jgi:hypothetical protein
MYLRFVGRQRQDRSAAGPAATVAPTNVNDKPRVTRVTLLNVATLAFIVAYLTFDWWAIDYLISH